MAPRHKNICHHIPRRTGTTLYLAKGQNSIMACVQALWILSTMQVGDAATTSVFDEGSLAAQNPEVMKAFPDVGAENPLVKARYNAAGFLKHQLRIFAITTSTLLLSPFVAREPSRSRPS
eukprot:4270648-Amphidinium_carterae.1